MPTSVPGLTEPGTSHSWRPSATLRIPTRSSARKSSRAYCTKINAASGSGSWRHAQAGATLLEMMVVLAIIGIVAGAAGLAVFPQSGQRALQREALRLSWLLPIAQTQVRANGHLLIWQPDRNGYRFRYLDTRQAKPGIQETALAMDPALRFRLWETPEPPKVTIEPPQAAIVTGEWMPQPLHIHLSSGPYSASLIRDAAGRYQVVVP